MNWTYALLVVAVVAVYLLVKRSSQLSSKSAVEYLKNGARVIDVRTAAEFTSGHLPKAINIPLSEVETLTPRRVEDKNQVLLLHCQSGMRSGAAMKIMRNMGYTQVFNLGSYGRAAGIVKRK